MTSRRAPSSARRCACVRACVSVSVSVSVCVCVHVHVCARVRARKGRERVGWRMRAWGGGWVGRHPRVRVGLEGGRRAGRWWAGVLGYIDA